MSVSAVAAPAAISAARVKRAAGGAREDRPTCRTAAPADGTRTPQPTEVAALPPGQGTRVDQFV